MEAKKTSKTKNTINQDHFIDKSIKNGTINIIATNSQSPTYPADLNLSAKKKRPSIK
jgi:hypothetical protein